MKSSPLFIAIIILFCFDSAFSQKKMKYGSIDKELLSMTSYDLDTSAAAVIVADHSRTDFQFSFDKGFEFVTTQHVRIKILNKNGYKYADHAIRYYSADGGSDEQVGSLKGVTYNLEDGNVIKTKLEKNGIFDEKSNKYWRQKKITLPNVKEGSVIEYKYSVKSPYVRNLRDWVFQYDIPLISAEYTVVIPEFLIYQIQQQGYNSLLKNGQTNYRKENFPYSYWEQTRSGNEKFTGNLESNSRVYEYEASNIPAFKKEPLITTKNDYISKVVFELSTVKYPRQPVKNMISSWEKLGKNLLESNSFGIPLKNTGYFKKITESIVTSGQSTEEKISTICSHLKNTIQWNGYGGRYIDNLKKAYEDKKGSAVEINLIMVSMLRHAGIQADPVILSTRDHGFIREPFPNIDQLNYVICKATLGEGYVLLDATDPYLPNNLLPENCLNDKGWVVSETNYGWVPLKNNVKKSIKVSTKLKISEDGELTGNMKTTYAGYFAREERKQIISSGEEQYKDDLIEKSTWELDEVVLTEIKKTSAPLSVSYNLESSNGLEVLSNTIYLSPIFALKEDENIFKSEERLYPVDYGCPEEKIYYAQIQIPDGYSVAEKPVDTSFLLPDKGGKYTYSISISGNTLIVISKLNINKPLFTQAEYPYLKQFFDTIITKHAEQIVLKKT